LPGGATLTGMIPDSFLEADRRRLLNPDIIIPVVVWLAIESSAVVTGKRFDASKWRSDLPPDEAATLCARDAGASSRDPAFHGSRPVPASRIPTLVG
jgi:hypothetical protein